MQRLQRLNPSKLAAGVPLPDVFGLTKKFPGAHFRRGQTALIAAEPNNGKSPLVLWSCVQWALQGLRVLYFSADTDEYVTWKRAAAAVTGQPTSYVTEMPKRNVSTALGRLGGRLSFVFDTDPSYDDIQEEVVAFWELWGVYPDVIVIDLLADVIGDNEDEFGMLREHTRAFKRLARAADACVVMVHHVNEEERKGSAADKRPTHPPARARITGKISKKPELVMTLLYDAENRLMMIAVVKLRDGEKTDESGQTYLTLRSDPERMQFYSLDHQKLGAAA